MAKIVNQAQTTVTVDGQQAAQELAILEKKAQAYKDQMTAAMKAQDNKAFEKAEKGLKGVRKEMNEVLRSSYDVNKVLNNLSAAGPKQLKAAMKALNKELGSGKVARGSQEWDELNRKLRLVRGELAKINAESNITKGSFSSMQGAMAVFAGNMMTKAIEVIGRGIEKIKDFVDGAIDAGRSGEGVRRAFERIGDPGLLDKMREQTRGLIGDFELMQAAVKAEKFKIPIQEVGNLLEFASRRAIDMGGNIDDFQKRIIEGIGKESKLRLDDLGITATQIEKAIAKEGNFAKGVISIVNEELAKQGPLAKTSADIAAQAITEWSNTQGDLGDQLSWIDRIWSQFSINFAKDVRDWINNQLPTLMQQLAGLYNWFVDFYNNSTLLRGLLDVFVLQFKSIYNVGVFVFDTLIQSVKNLGNLLKAAFTLDWELFAKTAQEGLNANIKNMTKLVKDQIKDVQAAVDNTRFGKLKPITIPVKVDTGNVIVPGTGGNEDNDKGKGDKAAEQRKKIQDALRKAEIDHNTAMIAIKKEFQAGEIKSESEYNQRLADQQNKYDEAQRVALNKLLEDKKITEKSVREEIEKQLTEIDAKSLDREIKRSAALKKIILDADPRQAEIERYENSLRELGLFGMKKEAMTAEQYAAAELLAKQHAEKMATIEKPEVARQLKQIGSEQARDEVDLAASRAKGLMTEQRYREQLILLDIAYTAKKLQIDGLSEEQRIALQKESFDKQQQLFEENAAIEERLSKNKKLTSLSEARTAEIAFLNQVFGEDLKNTEAYRQAEFAINQKYDLLEEERDKEKRQRQIEAAQFALDSLSQLMSSYSAYQQAANDAEVASVNKKYESQIKAAGSNAKRVKQLEEQRDAEIKELNRAAEDRSFKIQIAMALASTAQSAINAYSSTAAIPVIGPALAPVAAGVATAAGLLQVGAIRKQHEAATANYWDGGYTPPGGKYDVAGIVHKGEFVATQAAVTNPDIRPIFDIINQAQRNNTVSSLRASDFATALEYREQVRQIPRRSNIEPATTGGKDNNELLLSVLADIAETNRLTRARLNDPFTTVNTVTGDSGIQQALDLQEKMKRNITRQ